MNTERIGMKLTSVGPMLMNSSKLADPLDPETIALAAVTSKRRKTLADHRRIADLEWFGKLWLHEGRPCLTTDALEAVFIAAAKTRGMGTMFTGALVADAPAVLHYEGPSDIKKLSKDPAFRLRKMVRVRKALTPRTRPKFENWNATFTVTFLVTVINREQVLEYFRIAGSQIGVGDWRGKYGRFLVEEVPVK